MFVFFFASPRDAMDELMQAYTCWRPPIRPVPYPDYNGNDAYPQEIRTGKSRFILSQSSTLVNPQIEDLINEHAESIMGYCE